MWLESASIRLIQKLFLPGEINRMKGQPKEQDEGPFLAELRSPGSGFQRLLWRKQPLKLDESTAINPKQTMVSESMRL